MSLPKRTFIFAALTLSFAQGQNSWSKLLLAKYSWIEGLDTGSQVIDLNDPHQECVDFPLYSFNAFKANGGLLNSSIPVLCHCWSEFQLGEDFCYTLGDTDPISEMAEKR